MRKLNCVQLNCVPLTMALVALLAVFGADASAQCINGQCRLGTRIGRVFQARPRLIRTRVAVALNYVPSTSCAPQSFAVASAAPVAVELRSMCIVPTVQRVYVASAAPVERSSMAVASCAPAMERSSIGLRPMARVGTFRRGLFGRLRPIRSLAPVVAFGDPVATEVVGGAEPVPVEDNRESALYQPAPVPSLSAVPEQFANREPIPNLRLL